MDKKIPKKYVLRFNAKNMETLLAIKNGTKKVETRAGTDRYRKIVKGDVLVLVCGKERLEKEIAEAKHFKTIGALLKKFPVRTIAPKLKTIKEATEAWYRYPGYKEKIKKFGLMAFKLK